HNKLDVSNTDVLRKYKDLLPWDLVTISTEFVPTKAILNEFIDRLDWRFLSANVPFDSATLADFREMVDWPLVSKNQHLPFSINLIESFKFDWDYYSLLNNPAITIDVRDHIRSIIETIPEL